ncbi:MAG: hypothetical protein BGO74_10170 [Burkholderiales bacterium 68-12]|nr:MAG: hypothetical protein BGO74_10170 [Burkholderiales bacterium 68-12]
MDHVLCLSVDLASGDDTPLPLSTLCNRQTKALEHEVVQSILATFFIRAKGATDGCMNDLFSRPRGQYALELGAGLSNSEELFFQCSQPNPGF